MTLILSLPHMATGFVLINVEPGSEIEVHKVASKMDFVSEANVLFWRP
jgi:hypothetical protein